jgi:hypothetical protein
VVGIKHNNRKENYAGSEDVTRDHRCAHLAPSVTSLARTSRLMRRRRYSHVDGRRLLAGLGSATTSELRGRRRLPAQGPAADRETSATARRGNGVAATGLGTAATAQGRCRRSPSGSGATTASLGTAATAQGRCRRSPSGSGAAIAGLGTAATACRGRRAAATAATGRGSPPRALSGNRRR